ncbi:MAG TPA: nucleoside deaminase [Isosphaeraceae bacterium]|jgi:tRNA(Arg) A34 adenosine deaminase TadA|nr:nucleoside deaminase [Isosphaeraceae bacterium]
MDEQDYMRRAIRKAQEGIAAGQSPFGAVIVRQRKVIGETHNAVWRNLDPTAHAEINCIRRAAAAVQTIKLSGCTMFSTCEPCPMCLAAIHWSRIDRVVFGASIADAVAAGFRELHIGAKQLAEQGGSPLRVEGGLLRDECVALFEEWRAAGLSQPY